MVRRLLVSAGYGPPECQVAVARLAEEMVREAREAKLDVALVGQEPGPHGLSSALLEIGGDGVDVFAQGWLGTVRWICPSPVRANVARKNWFVAVSAVACPARRQEVAASDLKVQRLRASGPGGQHVNKTESAVRVTHIPTGLSVVSRQERSQHRNRALAEERIAARLGERVQADAQEAEAARWSRHSEVERGGEIRTYVGAEFRRKV